MIVLLMSFYFPFLKYYPAVTWDQTVNNYFNTNSVIKLKINSQHVSLSAALPISRFDTFSENHSETAFS